MGNLISHSSGRAKSPTQAIFQLGKPPGLSSLRPTWKGSCPADLAGIMRGRPPAIPPSRSEGHCEFSRPRWVTSTGRIRRGQGRVAATLVLSLARMAKRDPALVYRCLAQPKDAASPNTSRGVDLSGRPTPRRPIPRWPPRWPLVGRRRSPAADGDTMRLPVLQALRRSEHAYEESGQRPPDAASSLNGSSSSAARSMASLLNNEARAHGQ
jgi:hypothetical protein